MCCFMATLKNPFYAQNHPTPDEMILEFRDEHNERFGDIEVELKRCGYRFTANDDGKVSLEVCKLYRFNEPLVFELLTSAYSLSPDFDSTRFMVPGDKRHEEFTVKLYTKKRFAPKGPPEGREDEFIVQYGVQIMTLKERMSDADFDVLSRKIGLRKQRIEFYNQPDITFTNLYYYTIGRFENEEEAQKLLDYIVGKKIPSIKNPKIVSLLSERAKIPFYRVQVRSSIGKPLTRQELDQLSKKVKGEVVEIIDANYAQGMKYDYFLKTKYKSKEEANAARQQSLRAGVKGAFVVYSRHLEKKMEPVYARPVAKKKK